MLNGGPAVDYIERLNGKSEILLTGYQVEGTNGRMLMEKGTMKINGVEVKIPVKSAYYNLSAHASKAELYGFVKDCEPTTVICLHGDRESALGMAETLKTEGYDAHAPMIGETLKVN